MYDRIKSKMLKLCLTIVITISILFAAGMWLLTYHEEGETNIPFKISKIVVVSSTDGKNNNIKTPGEELSTGINWDINVSQNNDIFLYIDKNKNYGKTEFIENVKIKNFNIEKETQKGEIKIYKPSTEENKVFDNIQELEINELIYNGDIEPNIKNLKIPNQGGIIAFRCANNNISRYTASGGTDINYNNLLSMTNVSQEDLNMNISFDIEIKVLNKKTYQATVKLKLPVEDVITKGTTNLEITDLEDIVFKII